MHTFIYSNTLAHWELNCPRGHFKIRNSLKIPGFPVRIESNWSRGIHKKKAFVRWKCLFPKCVFKHAKSTSYNRGFQNIGCSWKPVASIFSNTYCMHFLYHRWLNSWNGSNVRCLTDMLVQGSIGFSFVFWIFLPDLRHFHIKLIFVLSDYTTSLFDKGADSSCGKPTDVRRDNFSINFDWLFFYLLPAVLSRLISLRAYMKDLRSIDRSSCHWMRIQ